MTQFDELKSKYQSVIQTAQAQGIQMMNLHAQDGKLFIKGMAPSMEAANRVWDEIKRLNPKLDDIIAEFPVNTKPAPGPAAQPQAQQPRPQMYTVKPGDTLSKISKQVY